MAKRKAGSTALVLHHPTRRESKPVEKLPDPQDVMIPAALMLAADSVSEHKDDKRPALQGVFLHCLNGLGRIVGTDGQRMFVASFGIEGEAPEWLGEGLILSNEGLKARVGMIAKGGEGAMVRITYASGAPKATLSDVGRSIAFQIDPQSGTFPDYDRVIGSNSFVRLDDDGSPRGGEWEPVGINSTYLKHVGEVAKLLEAGLPKEARSKKGMVVRAFNSSGSEKVTPLVFDFSTWSGAILVILPARLTTPGISAPTAALLAPAIRLTIAALRAHATRNLAWAEAAESEAERAAFAAKAESFQTRIAEVLKRAPGLPAIEAGEVEAEPASEPEEPAAKHQSESLVPGTSEEDPADEEEDQLIER